MHRRQTIFAILAMLALAACSQQQLMNYFIPKDEAALGQKYIDDVRDGRFDIVEQNFNPQYRNSQAVLELQRMRSLFPKEKLKNVKVVGSNTFTMSGSTTYNFTYEYEFSHGWVLVAIRLKKVAATTEIEGMRIFPMPRSLEEQNAFHLEGKDLLHYAFFAMAILIPIFCIITLIACIRTRVPRRKWLWIIFILLGFCTLKLNWTTGQIGFVPVSFLLLGAAYTQQFFGPVILEIGIPLGAIVFWLRRRAWIEAATNAPDLRN